MKKFFLSLCALIFVESSFYSVTRIGILRGMNSIPLAYMFDAESKKTDEERLFEFTVFDSPVDLFREMQKGYIDATVVSSLAAEGLVKKSDGQVKVTAIVSTTDFYIAGYGMGNYAFSNLVDRKLYVIQNALSTKMLYYMLDKNRIPYEEGNGGILVEEVKNSSELVEKFLSDKSSFALFSQPELSEVCSRSVSIRKMVDMQEQYQILEGNGKIVPLSVLVIRSRLENENMHAVQELKRNLEESLEQAVLKPRTAARIISKNKFGIPEKNCAEAIKKSNFNFIPVNGDFVLKIY